MVANILDGGPIDEDNWETIWNCDVYLRRLAITSMAVS